MDIEDIVNPDGPPAWLHLLSPMQRAWRETQILKGRNPDPYVVDRLKEAGKWPPKAKTTTKAKKSKKAKHAPRP
jgi:hypothetical protein